MKFTKIIATAFVALTMFSCSKELTDVDNGQVVQQGDAMLIVNLQQKTTYSTTLKETEIKVATSGAKLFKTDGTIITPKSVTYANGKFTIVVAATDYVVGSSAKLYLYANATSQTDANTGSNDEENHNLATVGTTVDRDLTDGAPAGLPAITLQLQAGTTDITAASTPASFKLKRAIARVDVKNGSKWYTDATYETETTVGTAGAVQIPINDYSVAFSDVNLTSGALYGGASNATSTVVATGSIADRAIDGVTTDMYGSRETLAYMYPSKDAKATITAPASVTGASAPKVLTFSPAANKNYTITITPFKSTSGTINYTTVIQDTYDEDIDLGDYDFNPIAKVKAGPISGASGFSGVNDGLVIDVTAANASLVSDNAANGVNILFSDIFDAAQLATENGEYIISPGTVISKALTSNEFVSTDGMFAISDRFLSGFKFYALPNYGADQQYTIPLEGGVSGDIYTLKVTIKGLNLPDNFTTTFNGFEIMSMPILDNTKGYQSSADMVKQINAGTYAGTTNFAEKAIAHLISINKSAVGSAGYYTIDDLKLKNVGVCPFGYRHFTNMTELSAFMGGITWVNSTTKISLNTDGEFYLLPGSTNTQYKVDATSNNFNILKDASGNQILTFPSDNFNQMTVVSSNSSRFVFYNTPSPEIQHSQIASNSKYNIARCIKDPSIPTKLK